MGASTVHVDLDDSESGESRIAYLVVGGQVDTPGGDSSLLAHLVLGLLVVKVVVASVEQLPIDKIFRAFKPPGQHHVGFRWSVPYRVARRQEAPT